MDHCERAETTNSVSVHQDKHKLGVCVNFYNNTNQHNRAKTAKNAYLLVKEIVKHMFFAALVTNPSFDGSQDVPLLHNLDRATVAVSPNSSLEYYNI